MTSGAGIPGFLAVVTPMANECLSAVSFLRDVLAQVACFERVEIFVVLDAASVDGTIELVQQFAAQEPRVRVIWAAENTSVVDAYVRGYREALASGAEWILEIDAGYSHSPADIPKFIAAIGHTRDCLFGSRFCKGGQMLGDSWKRYVISRGGTALTNLLIGTRLSDMTSGFQMFRRDTLARILSIGIRSRGPFFQTEMKVYARVANISEIPITYRPTADVLRSGSIIDALRVLLSLFVDRFMRRLASILP
jgi:dolichol-phosphate mannosyltransferase